MKSTVYMHTVSHSHFNSKRDLNTLSYVLKSGSLLSLRNQGYKHSSGFAGLDYISLCDYEKRHETNNGLLYYNAYYSYIRHGVSLAFDKDKIKEKYDVITPEFLDAIKYGESIEIYMQILGNEVKRYSDLPDEVQIKDKLFLTDICYLTYPCQEFFDSKIIIKHESKRKKLAHEINELKKVLLSYGYDLSIYDIDSGVLLNEEGVEKVLSLKK